MAHNPSVKVARLYEATSQRGNIAIVRSGEVYDSGQPIWNVLVSEPETKSEAPSKAKPAPKAKRPDHQAPPDHDRIAYQRQHMNDEIPL
jgi:hypothetical protein